MYSYSVSTNLNSFKIVINFVNWQSLAVSEGESRERGNGLAFSFEKCANYFLAGVGKSSLVHMLCHNQMLGNPSWTVGCSVDVRV